MFCFEYEGKLSIRDKLVKREKGQVEALRDTIRNSQAAQVYFTISARQFGIRRRRSQQTTNCCYRCSITPTFSNGFIMTNSSQVLVIGYTCRVRATE